jgi:DUF1365 family protein
MVTVAPALYEGQLNHQRLEGVEHGFSMALFLVLLDVDRIDASFDRLPGWSSRRPAPIRFRRRDHLDGSDRPLGDAVRDLVADRTGRRPGGPIGLLTQPRTAGWLFNPLSVYYCWTGDGGAVETIVLEVTSTPWHERTWYVIPVDGRPEGPWSFDKTMHVSPFLDMDLTYRLRAGTPGEHLDLQLDVVRDGRTVFAAGLTLRRRALDRRNAILVPLRHPLLTMRVSGGIYAQALRLVRKGVAVHRRPGPVPAGAATIERDRELVP